MSDNPEKIHCLKSLQVKNLWDEIDIEWELDPKVNILIGKNGTGKTTLLQLIDSVINGNEQFYENKFSTLHLQFNNEKYIEVENTRIFPNQKTNTIKDKSFRFTRTSDLSKIEQFDHYIHQTNFFSGIKKDEKLKGFDEYVNVFAIDTFDLRLASLKNKNFDKKNSEIKTDLDVILENLISDFKGYLLKLRNSERDVALILDKKIERIFLKENADKNELQELKYLLEDKSKKIGEIYQQQENFISIINRLFSDTGKTIDFDQNNAIIFNKNNKIITAYQLSSGEKQLLIILLTVIQQENQPSIILMDEPELSLHLSWQMELINTIQILNPNSQLVIATHSPSVFMKGWNDKITKMEDISTSVNAL